MRLERIIAGYRVYDSEGIIGTVERYYPTLESGHTPSGCPARRWTAKKPDWRCYSPSGERIGSTRYSRADAINELAEMRKAALG